MRHDEFSVRAQSPGLAKPARYPAGRVHRLRRTLHYSWHTGRDPAARAAAGRRRHGGTVVAAAADRIQLAHTQLAAGAAGRHSGHFSTRVAARAGAPGARRSLAGPHHVAGRDPAGHHRNCQGRRVAFPAAARRPDCHRTEHGLTTVYRYGRDDRRAAIRRTARNDLLQELCAA